MLFPSCRPAHRSASHRTQLRVEALEDRAVPSASPLLQDSFNDNTLDLGTWVSGLTDPDGKPAAIRTSNQRLEFTGPGSLISREEFRPSSDNPLEVSGVWTWTPTPGLVGTAQVVLRQNGTFVTEDGVEFRADPGVGLSIWVWQDRQATLLALAPTQIDVGDTFQFRVRDDGLHVSFSVAEVGGNGVAISLAADTAVESDAYHVAFRYGGVVFAPAARLALDEIAITPVDPTTPLPAPVPAPVPTPTTKQTTRPSILIAAIPLEFWLDDGAEEDTAAPSSSRRDMSRQVQVRRSRLRRAGGRRLRQTITLQNTSNLAVTDLKLAFSRLPKGSRVRLGNGEWLTAGRAARGVGLSDDLLNPGESLTIELEISNVPRGQARFRTQVLGSLEAPEQGTDDGFSSSTSEAASSASSWRDR